MSTTPEEVLPLIMARRSQYDRLFQGSSGWLYLIAGVILWDALVEEEQQLTHSFRRGLKTRRFVVGTSWAILTGHLFGILPEYVDPIHLLATIFVLRHRCQTGGYHGLKGLSREAGSSSTS